jgi:hypothetical protein
MNRSEDDANRGKVIPLKSRTSAKSEIENGQGKTVPLPLKFQSGNNHERIIGFFPKALKEYARLALIEYKDKNSIGNQKLRDLIMQPEDNALVSLSQTRAPKTRDTRLTLDDIKKWLSAKSMHQIGDPKFTFINRFLQTLRISGALSGYNIQHCEERRNYHRQALCDVLSNAYESEDVLGVLDGASEHYLIASHPNAVSAKFHTCLIIVHGFKNGVTPLTILFSEVTGKAENDKYNERFYTDLIESRFPLVYRGYSVLTTRYDYNDGPGPHVINARTILSLDDVEAPQDQWMPHSRILADTHIEIVKNNAREITQYTMGLDTTDFPEETSIKIKQGSPRYPQGSSVETAERRLNARTVVENEILQEIAEKFSGSYP